MTFMPLLSDQEHCILVMLANGKERAQIVKELTSNEGAVRNLITNICNTLGAENTHHAIAIGFCTGLLIEHNIDGFNVRPAAS